MELKESLLLQTKLGNITVDYDVNLLQPTQLDMGLTGFEPVTLRLSSACSNQLSYRPGSLKPICHPINPQWWRHGDSNPRPIACKATALPTELCPLYFKRANSVGPAARSQPFNDNCANLSLKQKLNCALPFQIFDARSRFRFSKT